MSVAAEEGVDVIEFTVAPQVNPKQRATPLTMSGLLSLAKSLKIIKPLLKG
jgi:hypothetical protein